MGLPVLPALHYRLDLPPQVTDVKVTEVPGTRKVERIGPTQLITENTDIRCDCTSSGAPAARPVITGTYPLRPWTASTDALPGATTLDLFTVLGQVDSSSVLTLTHHIEFTVSYVQPATGVTLGPLTVNNGAAISTGATSAPVRFSLTADRARPVLLSYSLSGGDGLTLTAGSNDYVARAGAQEVTLTLDASNWPAGPLYLQVTAADSDSEPPVVLDRRSSALRIAGIGVAATLASSKVEQGASLSLSLDAWDERGAPVEDLVSRFSLVVDQQPVTAVVTRIAPGRYSANLPTGNLAPASHTLAVRATDTRGLVSQTDVAFGVTAAVTRTYLPAIRR